jgi:hypothetical protein
MPGPVHVGRRNGRDSCAALATVGEAWRHALTATTRVRCYLLLGVVVVDGVAVPVVAGAGVTLTVAMRNSQLSPS